MNKKTGLAWTLMLSATAILSACGGGKKPPDPPAPTTYTIGGSITGLTSPGLVLQVNGANSITVALGATAFSSSNSLASGAAYSVTVLTQPSSQTCTVANGSGTVGSANVTNVALTCITSPTATFTIGGTVSGLTSSGLVLQLNGANNISVASGATTFTSTNTLTTGVAYAITVLTQPATQICTVTSGSGAVASTNVTNVAITCVTPPPSAFTIGGNVSGLNTSGLVLQVNGANNITVASAATTFTSSNTFLTGAAYAVTVLTQPATQTCSVTNGSGTVASANVTNVAVTCVSTYTVGVTVSGYTTSGLVLQLNGGNNLAPTASTAALQTFAPRLLNAAAYAVTVLTQPATQVCTVGNGSGTVAGADVTNVTVTCANTYTVGATVSGLSGSGLVLQLNGGNNLTASATSALQVFAPRLLTNTAYAVTVLTQPSSPAQQCTVTNGLGTIGTANVTNVIVACANTFGVSGTISGLTGTLGLLVNFAGPNAPAPEVITLQPGASSFATATRVVEGVLAATVIATQPAGQSCLVTRGIGLIEASDISGIAVTCVGNITSPLVGTYALDSNSGPNNYTLVTFYANGTYVFASRTLDDGCITNNNQPINGIEYGFYNWNSTTGLFRTLGAPLDSTGECGLHDTSDDSNAEAIVTKTGNSLSFVSTDLNDPFSATLTAVPSTTNTLIGSFGLFSGVTFTFLNNGTFFTVSTQDRPIGASNSGTFSGLEHGCYTTTSTALTLSFASPCLPSGSPAIDTSGTNGLALNGQPRTMNYTVNGDALTTGVGFNGTRLNVNAVTPPPPPPAGTYTVGGTVTGLSSAGLVLQLNNGNNVSVAAGSTAFTFANVLAPGVPYVVSVLTQPSAPTQRCTVTNGSGSMGSANVTNVAINCITPTTFTVSGTVTGLTGTLQVGLFTGPTATETLTLTPGTTSFTYATQLANGISFGTVITAQPIGQTCIVTRSSGLVANSDLSGTLITCMANTTSPLAGTYSGTFGGVFIAVNFDADGRYLLVLRQPDADDCRNASGQLSSNGIEYGVYNWNSTTGSFRVVGAVIDTTGECGFVSDSGGAPFEGTLTRNGNSVMVTFTDDDGNPATFTLMAGPNTTGQLFGTYGLPNGRFYILLGDGTYITTLPQARMTGAPANNYAIGFEHGCFTSTPTTITYNFTNTCVLPAGKLPIDLNGGWPFKSSASLTATGPYALSGDSLVLYAGTQFAYTVTRVIGN